MPDARAGGRPGGEGVDDRLFLANSADALLTFVAGRAARFVCRLPPRSTVVSVVVVGVLDRLGARPQNPPGRCGPNCSGHSLPAGH